MSKLLRIAPAAVLLATTTFMAPAIPAKDKDKDKTTSAQGTETSGKDAKAHKEDKHKKAGQHSDSGSTGSTADKPASPTK